MWRFSGITGASGRRVGLSAVAWVSAATLAVALATALDDVAIEPKELATPANDLSWFAIGRSGTESASGGYVLSGSIGQADASMQAAGGYELIGGFWANRALGSGATDVGPGTGEPAGQTLPLRFQMHPIRPNPFNPATLIDFDLPGPRRVVIRLYNVRGERVCNLLDAMRPGGRHSVQWHGRDDRGVQVGSGVYIVTIEAGADRARQKLTLLR